jgi:acetyltransferase-like isoleucine patch superfamily enzyme
MPINELFYKNPLTLWATLQCKKIYLEYKYRNINLSIGYNARVISSKFGKNNTIYTNAVLNNVSLGDFTYIADSSRINNASIGKFCCIGPEILAGLGKHPTRSFVSSHPIFFSTLKQSQITFVKQSYFEEYSPIKIGNDVWIGARTIILDGVSIGDGAIVAAGSVVSRDVPPYSIVGGVPAKIIRYRFEPDQIEILLNSKWWDRDVDWLRENVSKFHNIDRFICDIERN